MYLVREVMYCHPGKVKPMVEKFLKMSKLGEKNGLPSMRIMTDFVGERYWMIVAEMEVESLDTFEKMMSGEIGGGSAEDMQAMEEIMKDYHTLVQSGRREVYRVEG